MVIGCRCLSAGYIATANHNDFYEVAMVHQSDQTTRAIDITTTCVCGTIHRVHCMAPPEGASIRAWRKDSNVTACHKETIVMQS